MNFDDKDKFDPRNPAYQEDHIWTAPCSNCKNDFPERELEYIVEIGANLCPDCLQEFNNEQLKS